MSASTETSTSPGEVCPEHRAFEADNCPRCGTAQRRMGQMDHVSPEASAVAEKVSESTNRQKLVALSAEAADLATAMSQRGDTEGSFYARGLRDAYAIAAAFWSGSEVSR